MSREVSQTPWEVDGVILSSLSVQEEIGSNIKDEFGTDKICLHSAGREDIDVRMLG